MKLIPIYKNGNFRFNDEDTAKIETLCIATAHTINMRVKNVIQNTDNYKRDPKINYSEFSRIISSNEMDGIELSAIQKCLFDFCNVITEYARWAGHDTINWRIYPEIGVFQDNHFNAMSIGLSDEKLWKSSSGPFSCNFYARLTTYKLEGI